MFDALTDALGYVGSSLDKAGPRPLRGLLAGKPRELASIVPFSDELGLTDPHDITSGRDITDQYGWTRKGADDAASHAVGMLAEALIDPLALTPALNMGVRGLRGAGLLGSKAIPLHVHPPAGPIDDMVRMLHPEPDGRMNALGLKYDDLATPPSGLGRHDPEWVNNKTWYHGSGTPGLTGDQIDPMLTNPENLFGRGIYKTADEGIARNYTRKGLGEAARSLRPLFEDDDFIRQAGERASRGEFDDWVARSQDQLFVPGERERIARSPSYKLLKVLETAKNGMDLPRGDRRYEPYREITDMLLGARAPKPIVYQSQPNFGRILDLDRRVPADIYESIRDAISGFPDRLAARGGTFVETADRLRRRIARIFGELPPGTRGDKLIDGLMELHMHPHGTADPVLVGLRRAGIDAATHTGGLRGAAGSEAVHQVLIGLDPNDVLGVGRKTPYQKWEPFARGP